MEGARMAFADSMPLKPEKGRPWMPLPQSITGKKQEIDHSLRFPVCSSSLKRMAGPTRLELATSGVTGRRSNQLNYDPAGRNAES